MSSVTSSEAALAVAVSVVPTFTLPDASSETDVTLTDPGAAIFIVAVVAYVLPPTFAVMTQRT